MRGIYFDEAMKCKIDLRAALWSTDKLHEVYRATIGNELSDVDWIAETESDVFLIEYKNTSFAGKNGKNEFYTKMWKKYYGSAFFMFARKNTKAINFICIIEPESMDSVQRRRATASIKKRLPYTLQESPLIFTPLINDFKIVTIEEWNSLYPYFPLVYLG